MVAMRMQRQGRVGVNWEVSAFTQKKVDYPFKHLFKMAELCAVQAISHKVQNICTLTLKREYQLDKTQNI